MGFVSELAEIPSYIFEKVEFKNREVVITFLGGNQLSAICPDGNDEYEKLMVTMTQKLGKEKVFIQGEKPESLEVENEMG